MKSSRVESRFVAECGGRTRSGKPSKGKLLEGRGLGFTVPRKGRRKGSPRRGNSSKGGDSVSPSLERGGGREALEGETPRREGTRFHRPSKGERGREALEGETPRREGTRFHRPSKGERGREALEGETPRREGTRFTVPRKGKGKGSPRRGNSSKGGDSVSPSLEGGEGSWVPRRGGVSYSFSQMLPFGEQEQAAASASSESACDACARALARLARRAMAHRDSFVALAL